LDARRWTPLFLGSVAAACGLAAWLFLPRAPRDDAALPPLEVVLVDASASVSRAAGWLPWVRAALRSAALDAQGSGAELAVAAYADGVASAFSPGAPALFLERLEGRSGVPLDPAAGLPRGATRLADALVLAEPLLLDPRRPAASLRLLAPPGYTGTTPVPGLVRLAAAGVPVTVVAPPAPELSDLGVRELVVAPRVEAGGPLTVLARLFLRRGTRAPEGAVLEVETECDGTRRSFVQPLVLPLADGSFEVPLACGPAGFGRNEVRVRCRLAPEGRDLLAENDRARASTTAEGARPIGVFVSAEKRAAAEAWLAPAGRSALAGLQFLFRSPDELGAELGGLAAVISFDLAPSELDEPLLASWVRSGGGWLALSGYAFLNEWLPGEEGGPLHGLLPCEPAHSEPRPRDVVLLIDGSGSMRGEPFETVRAAALELVAAALPSDRVSLRFFTTSLEREHLLKERAATRAEDRDAAQGAARALLALRAPGGTTYLLRSLREVASQAGATETETLALLLTDGRERDALPDPTGMATAVSTELQAAGARLVVIAVGDPNRALLAALAGGADRVRDGHTLEDLRDVFHAELHGPQLAEGDLELHEAPRAPGSLADQVHTAGAETRALPHLERLVRNRLRPGGEALWLGAEEEPVLALARAGRGRVALFASLPADGWAPALARAGLGEPAEFEGLLRWLARGPEGSPDPRARVGEDGLRVTGLGPGTPAVLAGELRGPDARLEVRLLAPSVAGAGIEGTRVARLSGPVPEDAHLVLGVPEERVLWVERALPPEYAWDEHALDPEPWSRPAARTAEGRGTGSSPAAPWVLGLALLGFLGAGLAVARGQGAGDFGR